MHIDLLAYIAPENTGGNRPALPDVGLERAGTERTSQTEAKSERKLHEFCKLPKGA
jgi:hypothetical protein